MPASVYRWLMIHPLCRGSLLSLAVAAVCVGSLFLTSATAPSTVAPLLTTVAAETPANVDQAAEWPLMVVRLWLLVPQLLPQS